MARIEVRRIAMIAQMLNNLFYRVGMRTPSVIGVGFSLMTLMLVSGCDSGGNQNALQRNPSGIYSPYNNPFAGQQTQNGYWRTQTGCGQPGQPACGQPGQPDHK